MFRPTFLDISDADLLQLVWLPVRRLGDTLANEHTPRVTPPVSMPFLVN